jgi:hypothetical protein
MDMNQRKSSALFRTVSFLLVALVLPAAAALAQSHGEQFTANLVDPAGAFGATTAPMVIHIDHYSSDAEIQQLATVLQQKGPNALRDALWDKEVGYLRIGGGLGYPIAVARSHPAPNGGRLVRLMIDRPISPREVINNSRTVDYPFGFIELKLDASGKGEGTFYQAAKVKLSGGKLDIENYSPQPLRLLAVRGR